MDNDLPNSIAKEKEKWRNILTVVVDTILFCAKHNVARWDTTEQFDDPQCGIFLRTLELIIHYHTQLAEHIESVKTKKNTTSYFYPQTQNEIIILIGKKITREIIARLQKAKCYSIMFDCTHDTSHRYIT